jgi:hypothetical protein
VATYLVGYDLNKPTQNYEALIDALKQYGTWWHHLDSTWFIVTDDTAVEVRDNLQSHLDSNDELLVAAIGAPAAWAGINDKGSAWLMDHLK